MRLSFFFFFFFYEKIMSLSPSVSVGMDLFSNKSTKVFLETTTCKTWLRCYQYGRRILLCQTGLWKCQFCIWKAFSCHNTQERHITATILLHTSSYDNSFKCQTYVCREKRRRKYHRGKGKKVRYAEYHKFLCVRWCCFFFFFNRINVLIAPVRSQDHAPYWLC